MRSANAGFSPDGVKTWLPVPPTYTTVNVKDEQAEPDSLFVWYQSLIRLKKTNPAFVHGDNSMLDTDNTKVLSWIRKVPGSAAVVVSVNFTADPQTVNLSVPGSGGKVKTLMRTPGSQEPASLQSIELGPFGVYIGEVVP